MSVMKFREPNQVLWRGVRPGHNGTQVIAFKDATAGTLPLYTVGVGETLYLCTVGLGITTDVTGFCRVDLRDDGDAFIATLLTLFHFLNIGTIEVHETYWPPMELLAGYYLEVVSGAAGLTARAHIFGWEE